VYFFTELVGKLPTKKANGLLFRMTSKMNKLWENDLNQGNSRESVCYLVDQIVQDYIGIKQEISKH